MIKVTVLDSQINERGGSFTNDRNENVEFTTRKQRGKLEADGFAYPFDVRLDKGQPGYQAGEYELDVPAMLQVNKGVATLSKFTVLRPLQKAAPRPTAQA
ncbi:G5P family DNA-binding protein [Stenotrophomonas maltophilia]|uniref:G5P family DNA-binding protein n=1 Tax=Stenotrophomonas maltophilia TaxID=40324 RepID=UPI0021C8CC24|nr:G5P family DNA-binding protein [Stenotrophomonas maltophilia]MCU1084972.1 single-stranded DNA-binding protein [Stenotrophomonas maltophilia]MCU1161380.1 single-stranded DNA-binding protein [Stenotrophomonas maltophilia]